MHPKINEETVGELTIFGSAVIFGFGAVMVKYAAGFTGAFFIAFIRFFSGIILGIALLLITYKRIPKLGDKKLLIIRGIFGAGAMTTYFLAVQYTTAGRATLMNATYGIFAAIFGAILFKEKIKWNTLVGIILSFGGMFFIFSESGKFSILGDVLGLISGIIAGFSVHYIRKARQTNHSIIVYLAACLFGLVVTSFSVGNVMNVTLTQFGFLMLVGIVIFAAHVILSYGMKFVPATKGAVITYLKVPLAVLFAFIILNEKLTPRFIIGTSLIVGGLILNSSFRRVPKTVDG